MTRRIERALRERGLVDALSPDFRGSCGRRRGSRVRWPKASADPVSGAAKRERPATCRSEVPDSTPTPPWTPSTPCSRPSTRPTTVSTPPRRFASWARTSSRRTTTRPPLGRSTSTPGTTPSCRSRCPSASAARRAPPPPLPKFAAVRWG